MKRKLAGAYFFEWLGKVDRANFRKPRPLDSRNGWPEFASTAYVYGYFYN